MPKPKPTKKTDKQLLIMIVVSLVAATTVTALLKRSREGKRMTGATSAPPSLSITNPPATNILSSTLEVNQAVMVTVDLDYGGQSPSIAEALNDIERRYQPADGSGRTFAILDAHGGPTFEKKLRVSMHVSSEKVGGGSLVFRRTGQTLWNGRFNPAGPDKKPPGAKNLMIYFDSGGGRTVTVDGSSNPLSILDATIKELGQPLREIWPDGQEREMTFVYSTCGCPVKVMTRREGDRTKRTKDLPVIFPDDPTAVSVIAALMRW